MTRSLLLAGCALLASFAPYSAVAASTQNPCLANPTQPQWRVFVDPKDGFCLEYPPDYKRIHPMLNGRPCSVRQGCLLSLEKKAPPSVPPNLDDEYNSASIGLSNMRVPFRLKSLERYAPTGYVDVPPEPVQFGSSTFYYYGPGGGGVTYPDTFYFNVRGHTFGIDFDGPYIDDRQPARVTKDIEAKMLSSLRRF